MTKSLILLGDSYFDPGNVGRYGFPPVTEILGEAIARGLKGRSGILLGSLSPWSVGLDSLGVSLGVSYAANGALSGGGTLSIFRTGIDTELNFDLLSQTELFLSDLGVLKQQAKSLPGVTVPDDFMALISIGGNDIGYYTLEYFANLLTGVFQGNFSLLGETQFVNYVLDRSGQPGGLLDNIIQSVAAISSEVKDIAIMGLLTYSQMPGWKLADKLLRLAGVDYLLPGIDRVIDQINARLADIASSYSGDGNRSRTIDSARALEAASTAFVNDGNEMAGFWADSFHMSTQGSSYIVGLNSDSAPLQSYSGESILGQLGHF
ncbi:MAG: hypothetical protein AB1Z21_13095 [Synechococcaceae cyanobacterium]